MAIRYRNISLGAKKGFEIFDKIPIHYTKPDFANALNISKQEKMYAYDAYLLDCAMRHTAPLLTLDRKLKKAAENYKIETMEV